MASGAGSSPQGGSNLPPEQMTARSRFCRCGHSDANHYSWNTGGPSRSCQATVYEVIDNGPLTSGMNAHPCRCAGFEEADGG